MKVTDFINSKSIAKHLDGLHYDFNAAEAAFIVWQSKCSMRKKYAAWQDIIDCFPDMPVSSRRWGIERDEPSFIALLKNYVFLRRKRKPFPYGVDMFEGMWFAFPTPFKVGDIVYQGNRFVYDGDEIPEPFVLLDIASWGEKELRQNGCRDEKHMANMQRLLEHHIAEGDVTDMLSAGYFANDIGSVYREHTLCGTYLDLEYYTDPLPPEKQILTAVSNYVNKKIDIATLANAYVLHTDLSRIAHIKKHTGCAYLDNQLALTGVKWK